MDAFGRLLPHGQARIEHPVDRGNAEARSLGDISDGGAARHDRNHHD
jgi:hypothetical protein